MRKFLLTSALTLAFFASGCCVHDAAMMTIDRAIAANKGHMDDASLPTEAREIAQDNHDVFHQLKFNLEEVALPEDVAARQKAREDAKKAKNDAKTERAENGGE